MHIKVEHNILSTTSLYVSLNLLIDQNLKWVRDFVYNIGIKEDGCIVSLNLLIDQNLKWVRDFVYNVGIRKMGVPVRHFMIKLIRVHRYVSV